MKPITALLLSLFLIAPAMAEKRYVTDQLWLQLRSGPSSEFRIIKALKSGSHLQLIEQNEETGYSKVTTDKGLEGYVLTRFLVNEPIAFEKLILTNRELEKAKADLANLQAKHVTVKTELADLKRDNESLSSSDDQQRKELDHIKKVSANALNLDQKNKELMEKSEELEITVDAVKAENERLRSSQEWSYLISGGGLIFLGILLGLLAPKLTSKRSDGWS